MLPPPQLSILSAIKLSSSSAEKWPEIKGEEWQNSLKHPEEAEEREKPTKTRVSRDSLGDVFSLLEMWVRSG